MTLKVWSLPDLMKAFKLGELTDLMQNLQAYQSAYQNARGEPFNFKEDLYTPTHNLKKAEELCCELGWMFAYEKLKYTNIHNLVSPHTADWSSIAADFRHALDVINDEAKRRTFIQIEGNYFNSDAFFGESVGRSFPSAVGDIRAAGNCIAVEEGTAAVFHLMRVVEWGLRSLSSHLGITRVRKSRKPKEQKYTALAYSQWENILREVHDRVDKKILKMSAGKRKQETQEFYYPLLRDLKGFKDAWRNHVMHTRATYSTKDAEAILGYVKSFMVTLATKVSE